MSVPPPPSSRKWQDGQMPNSKSMLDRAKSAASAPLRHQAQYLNRGLEDLIHAVKNELMARLDPVEAGVNELSAATTDHLGLLSSRILALEAEIGALRSEVAALKKSP